MNYFDMFDWFIFPVEKCFHSVFLGILFDLMYDLSHICHNSTNFKKEYNSESRTKKSAYIFIDF